MAITKQAKLDRANPAELASCLQEMGLGTVLAGLLTPATETGLTPDGSWKIVLKAIPAAVLCVLATAGTSAGAKAAVPAGVSPAAGQVAVDYSTGTLTFNATDAVTAASVVYLTAGGTPALLVETDNNDY